jgi:hypothetical protein
MRSGQVATIPVTAERIIRDPAFALGAADVRAGLPFRQQYDRWDTNTQWNYERGLAWALTSRVPQGGAVYVFAVK